MRRIQRERCDWHLHLSCSLPYCRCLFWVAMRNRYRYLLVGYLCLCHELIKRDEKDLFCFFVYSGSINLCDYKMVECTQMRIEN